MNILLLGSGGREHALAYKMKQSPLCGQLYIAPGNGGTGEYGTNVPLQVHDFEGIATFCQSHTIGLVVVGPEDPLVNGIYDFLKKINPKLIVVGPSANAAQLEGSKAFAKAFMHRHQIPTAGYQEFTAKNYQEGLDYLKHHSLPVVLKADGLAAGKGVVICQTNAEAQQVFEEMIQYRQFGEASAKVVVEEFLDGIEVSVFALTDGKNYKILGHAKDYKRIGEGDTGLNTGGMGCVSPVPFVDADFMQKIISRIVEPTIRGFAEEEFDYKGFVFFGLIKVGTEPWVIEYNCRLGDPETEVVLPLLQSDLVYLFVQMESGSLAAAEVAFESKSAATVMLVSGGYPGDYEKGKTIHLPTSAALLAYPNVQIFHAGTCLNEQGELCTNGGRVLAITTVGTSIQQAAANSKAVAALVQFEGKYYRTDIGYEFE